ncbi:GNAT family N-acetyltransferase [Sedimentitalea nanhaiensis]|uniref:Protein N-acetyltransferase, RimJ/RimL family n=1 Tax=Sedimentitalea nanhaiensis TaxID=999627 RepID=A0A1I7DLE7_9RHOB|nr:GNAT family N-acetyltransferase [Sedimentitalea nanhaiensis]SFU12490.1 Protein N-acetyltransferase, RimJ/RimL family [Sedimentitalea nanhaiensis]
MPHDIEFVPYDDTFLSLSWGWLNDPEIKALTMTPDFSRAAQASWYDSLPGRGDYLIWGVMYASRPVGVCGLKGIADGTGEYWGYIGDKTCWGKGVGGRMVGFIEDQARALGLGGIWLRVWDGNSRARGLYEKLGYRLDRHADDVVLLKKPLH